MHFWYLRDLVRLNREQTVIAELANSAGWLVSSHWMFDGAALALDAVIRAHGHDYQVRLSYPDYFPASPPSVHPTGATSRWTSHQYGDVNGALCLEWGPDTWHPEITGAQVLESTYRLFEIENPLGDGGEEARYIAPSRHSLTQGQELRFNQGRLYISPNLRTHLTSIPVNTAGTIKFAFHLRQSSGLGLIFQIQLLGSTKIWEDKGIPSAMKGLKGDESLSPGVVYKTTLSGDALQPVDNLVVLTSILQEAGCDSSILIKSEEPNAFGVLQRPVGILIIDNANGLHFFLTLDGERAWRWMPVYSEDPNKTIRQPENVSGLAEKQIGIVGMGSAGSKIAESLARMGVGRFYLLDHDLFLPENVVRHALDWHNVAEHKVDGVKDLIQRINPATEVIVSRLHLTGQESTAALSGALQSLGMCDIIIDATANSRVFNLLAHIALSEGKPFIWFEVYGGGGGGMIARSRLGIDPTPYAMREVYYSYCREYPVPEGTVIADYMTEDGEGTVMTASDADVGIISLHVARFAADTVLGRNGYPYSLYLIGLSQWWIFDQPFQNIQIPTDIMYEEGPTVQDLEAQRRGNEFIEQLLEKRANGTDTSS